MLYCGTLIFRTCHTNVCCYFLLSSFYECYCKANPKWPMVSFQVNKEVAQILKRRFQFQPRAQANMPVLQELQPYVVMGRRLQSVIASDNESVNSGEINYPGPR